MATGNSIQRRVNAARRQGLAVERREEEYLANEHLIAMSSEMAWRGVKIVWVGEFSFPKMLTVRVIEYSDGSTSVLEFWGRS